MNDDHSNNNDNTNINYERAMLGIGVLIGMIVALSIVYILMKLGVLVIQNS